MVSITPVTGIPVTDPGTFSITPVNGGLTGLGGSSDRGSFNGLSNMNTAVYWGQGANQERLRHYCDDDGIDIINIAFLNVFPDQSGGYPGTDFGNACGSETFQNKDGSDSPLLSYCPHIGPDIEYCQNTKGKTILLSLGGLDPDNQYIENHHSAVKFADFLWQAFGPEDSSSDVPRPFGDAVVDGFDFDIESVLKPKKKEQKGYGTMIDTLRTHFTEDLSKTYYISGAPQCIIPDAHLARALETSWFDFIFVQFYDTPECSARAYFDHSYGGVDTDISFDGWVDFVQTKALNKDAKIYLGLPAASDIPNDSAMYLNPKEAKEILEHFQCKYPDQFGGAMVYEATSSDENRHYGKSYVGNCKNALKHNDQEQCASKHHGNHHHHSSSMSSSTFPSMTLPSIIPTGGFPTGLFPTGSGIFPVYPSGTGIPTGVFPTGVFPTGVFPTGVFPTGVFPTGVFPSGSVIPSGIFPSGSAIPSGVFPSGSVIPSGVFPSGVFPSGSVIPSGIFPSGGVIPSGVFPSGSVIPSGVFPSGGVIPSGVFPSGSVIPSGVFPSGSVIPSGVFPSGSVIPSGVFPSGSAIPTGVFPSGSVIPSGVFPSGSVHPSGSVIPSGIVSPSSSAPSSPTGTAPSNSGSVSSIPTIPSSSQPFYPLTNSSRPATTPSQSQTSENSSPTTTANSSSQTSENSSPTTTAKSPSQTSEKSSPTTSGGSETTTSVVFETDVLTVTSCGPEVTNCPARSHSAVTTVIPVSTITQAPSQAPQPTQEVVVTEIVTSYVTTCPVAHTITSAGSQVVQTEITTSTVYETIISTICTKCVAPQKTAAPAGGSHSGSNSGSHNQAPAQGSSNSGTSHPGSNSGSQGPNSPSSPGSNAPGAMGHGAANVQATPGSQTPGQSPAEQGTTAGQNQGQSPAQSPAEQGPTAGQSQGQSAAQPPAEQGQSLPSQIASTVSFVPVETMTIVPVPKYPYQTAHPSAVSGSGSNATSPSGTVSAGFAAGTGSQHVEAFKGAASRMGAGVFGVIAAVMAVVVMM